MAGRPARLAQGEVASQLSGSQKGLSFQDVSSGGNCARSATWTLPGRGRPAGALPSRRRPEGGGRSTDPCTQTKP